nr:HTH domain-containing protein [Halomicroarcula amylolytica]
MDLDATANDQVLEIYRQFEQWAASHNAKIHPPFTVRHINSTMTGDTRYELVTPVLCLALSISQDLTGVVPHTAAGKTYTAQDVVDTLEAGDALDTLSPAIQIPPHHDDEHAKIDASASDDPPIVPDPP